MKTIIYLISLLTLMTCQNQRQLINRELKSDKLISEYFSDKEIQELGKIIYFFEEQISEGRKEKDISNIYSEFLKKDSIRMFDSNKMFFFDYSKQEKLYLNLDTVFFKTFWEKGTGIDNPKSKQELNYEYYYLKVYDENSFSKYSKFIKKLSEENKFIKKYYETVEITNSFFTPASSLELTGFYRNYNKEDIKIRLIYSLHYLNINEYYKHLQ